MWLGLFMKTISFTGIDAPYEKPKKVSLPLNYNLIYSVNFTG